MAAPFGLLADVVGDAGAVTGIPVGHPGRGGTDPAQDYLRAVTGARDRIRAGFAGALESVDVLLTPATPSPAVPISKIVETTLEGDKVDTFATFIKYLVCARVAGLPAIAVPAGRTATGLPVGLQRSREWDEERLTRVAAAYEALATD